MSDLLDLIALSRDVAIRQVDQNADADWKSVAYATGFQLAQRQQSITSEEIFDAMPSDVGTHEPRAMGAVMRKLSKDGVISPSNEFVRSTSVRGHGRPSRVWKSRVFSGVR